MEKLMQNTKMALTQLQKKKLDDLQRNTHQVISDFGQLAITKIQLTTAQNQLTNNYQQLQKQIEKFNTQLKNKYGQGQIDFQSGFYIKE